MVYQESYNEELNQLIIYDIDQRAFTKTIGVNPNARNMRYVYMDDQGYNSFKIVRSAELITSQKYNCEIQE